MTKEECKSEIECLEAIISPYQSQINTIKSRLEMLEYNEFREDVQKEIEILQKQLPHLGKFYFDEEYIEYDDDSHYYIYYQNEREKDRRYFISSLNRLYNKYRTKYILFIDREPHNVYINRIFGREVE